MSKKNFPAKVPHLTIEDRTLYFTHIEGQWWIAIKPICEALGVDYKEQHKNLKADPILGAVSCERTMQVPLSDGVGTQGRKMTCVSEQFIYGWLFQVRSKSPKLVDFKRRCYIALWEHFHGITIERQQFAKEVAGLRIEAQMIRERLASNPDYLRLKDITGKEKELVRSVRKNDTRMIEEQIQMELFIDE